MTKAPPSSTQRPFEICAQMHMRPNWAWTWSSLWPAATEMCLFNHQIKFMASFFSPPHGCPSTFKRRNTIPLSFRWGPGLFSLSPLLLAVLRGPQQLSLSLCTLTRLASSPSLLPSTSPPLLSSPLISARPPLFKASAQALSQVLQGRNLAWFFRPVCWLCCGNCLLRGTRLCSAPLSSPPDVNTQPRLLLAPLKSLVKITTGPVLVVIIITTDTC